MKTLCLLLLLAAVAPCFAATGRITLGEAHIDVEIDPALAPVRNDLMVWVRSSADTIARFYGKFPTPALALSLHARRGRGVQGGVTTNTDGAEINVRVGTEVTPAELAADWVLVHEMVHLALPEVGRNHPWLSEGLATYIEGIARAQAGRRSAPDVWAEYKHSMPVGVPKEGEGGLDQTHTWARTYWGGALFCLIADVTIRQQSKNRYSLRDGLAAVLRETGGYASDSWQKGTRIDDVLRIADEATHSRVLTSLYREWKETAVRPDLPRLWEELGVRGDGAGITFDERAALAGVRAAMTKGDFSRRGAGVAPASP